MTSPPTDERGVTDAMVIAALQAYISETGTVDSRDGDLLHIDHEGMRSAIEAALYHQDEVVESENERIGAFVRRVEREGANNLHQSMANAFITHALSGEHDEAG